MWREPDESQPGVSREQVCDLGNLARTKLIVIPMHRYQLRRRKRKSNHVVGTGTLKRVRLQVLRPVISRTATISPGTAEAAAYLFYAQAAAVIV